MDNEKVLKMMQTQLKLWQNMRMKDLNNMEYIVAICEVKDGIKVIEKAIDINHRYNTLFNTDQESLNT